MFYYKNRKFHKKGVSFSIPNDVLMLENERQSEEFFEICDCNFSFRINIVFESFAEPSQFFESDDFKDCYTVIQKPKSVCIGGLCGQKAIYKDDIERFCEYRFKITDKNNVSSTLSVLIRTDNPKTDILSVSNHRTVTELLHSLEISKE